MMSAVRADAYIALRWGRWCCEVNAAWPPKLCDGRKHLSRLLAELWLSCSSIFAARQPDSDPTLMRRCWLWGLIACPHLKVTPHIPPPGTPVRPYHALLRALYWQSTNKVLSLRCKQHRKTSAAHFCCHCQLLFPPLKLPISHKICSLPLIWCAFFLHCSRYMSQLALLLSDLASFSKDSCKYGCLGAVFCVDLEDNV